MALGSSNSNILSVSKAVFSVLPESDPRPSINIVLRVK